MSFELIHFLKVKSNGLKIFRRLKRFSGYPWERPSNHPPHIMVFYLRSSTAISRRLSECLSRTNWAAQFGNYPLHRGRGGFSSNMGIPPSYLPGNVHYIGGTTFLVDFSQASIQCPFSQSPRESPIHLTGLSKDKYKSYRSYLTVLMSLI